LSEVQACNQFCHHCSQSVQHRLPLLEALCYAKRCFCIAAEPKPSDASRCWAPIQHPLRLHSGTSLRRSRSITPCSAIKTRCVILKVCDKLQGRGAPGSTSRQSSSAAVKLSSGPLIAAAIHQHDHAAVAVHMSILKYIRFLKPRQCLQGHVEPAAVCLMALLLLLPPAHWQASGQETQALPGRNTYCTAMLRLLNGNLCSQACFCWGASHACTSHSAAPVTACSTSCTPY
jgi:hypothetical protein